MLVGSQSVLTLDPLDALYSASSSLPRTAIKGCLALLKVRSFLELHRMEELELGDLKSLGPFLENL